MKEKIFNFIFCLFSFISIIIIFKNSKEVSEIIINSINLFFKKVFPSLFPMFIINDLLININLPYYFYLIFNKLFLKLFNTSGICAYVFIMSLISGSPSNAYILKELLEKKVITIDEANHYLMFTFFSNPLFLTIMLSMLFNFHTVIKIILIHYISNILIGLIIRNKAPKILNSKLKKEKIKKNFLLNSINKSINTLLMILGTITFYMLLTYIITFLLKNNLLITAIISGFLEITNGLNNLNNVQIFIKLKEIIAISIISFGGLSIHTQIKSILENTRINYLYFLKGRILHFIISALLITIV